MDGNLTGNIREFLPIVGEQPCFGPFLGLLCCCPCPQLEPGPPLCLYPPPGHVQVAQVPGRGDPGSPGELSFPYLFQLLEDEGYSGFVGCEYQPRGEGGLRLQAWPREGKTGGTGIGQRLFSSWLEMPPPSPLRRHSGGLELAAFLLGPAGPPAGWPVRPAACPHVSGTVS